MGTDEHRSSHAALRSLLICAASAAAIVATRCFALSVASAAEPAHAPQAAHYRIHTDLERPSPRSSARRLDAMYDEYASRLARLRRRPTRDEKFEVYLFAKRARLHRLHAKQDSRTPAASSCRRGTCWPRTSKARAATALRRTLQHEAFHQFAFTADRPRPAALAQRGPAPVSSRKASGPGRSSRSARSRRGACGSCSTTSTTKQLVPFRDDARDDATTSGRNADDRRRPRRDAVQPGVGDVPLPRPRQRDGEPIYRPRFLDMLKRIHDGARADGRVQRASRANIDGFQARFAQVRRQRSKPRPRRR